MRHSASACETRLQALPNYDRFRCQPPEFICACGRHWVHVCDEAEGCEYRLAPDVHLPALVALRFEISPSEARRNITLGGVRLNGELVHDLDVPGWRLRGKVLRLGKRREVQL